MVVPLEKRRPLEVPAYIPAADEPLLFSLPFPFFYLRKLIVRMLMLQSTNGFRQRERDDLARAFKYNALVVGPDQKGLKRGRRNNSAQDEIETVDGRGSNRALDQPAGVDVHETRWTDLCFAQRSDCPLDERIGLISVIDRYRCACVPASLSERPRKAWSDA